MSMPNWLSHKLNPTRVDRDPNYVKDADPGKACVVLITDADTHYTAYTRNAASSIRRWVMPGTPIIVLTNAAGLDIPEADTVLNISKELTDFGMTTTLNEGRFPSVVFAKYLAPILKELSAYDRIICFDPDVMANNETINDLLDLSFQDKSVMACWDTDEAIPRNLADIRSGLDRERLIHDTDCAPFIENEHLGRYFGAGLIIWNASKIRKGLCGYNHTVRYIVEKQLRCRFAFPEQHWLAICFDVLPLSRHYDTIYTLKTAEENAAAVYHFPGQFKAELDEICFQNGLLPSFHQELATALNKQATFTWNPGFPNKDSFTGYFEQPASITLCETFPAATFYGSATLKETSPDYAILWTCWPTKRNRRALKTAQRKGATLVLAEEGLLRGATTYADHAAKLIHKTSISTVADTHGFYYDAGRPTDVEAIIKKLTLTTAERNRARTLIDFIVGNKLSKYNHQPIEIASLPGEPDIENVLVVDQDYGDYSTILGGETEEAFASMLRAATLENKTRNVLVKTHPDALFGENSRRGYYADIVPGNGVYKITDPANPYSVLERVSSVYVGTSTFGFEALMAGKPVHTFGMPWYAGWGATTDRLSCPRRNVRRTVEELFYAFYVRYTHWYNPLTCKPCEIEEALDALLALREDYAKKTGVKCVPN